MESGLSRRGRRCSLLKINVQTYINYACPCYMFQCAQFSLNKLIYLYVKTKLDTLLFNSIASSCLVHFSFVETVSQTYVVVSFVK